MMRDFDSYAVASIAITTLVDVAEYQERINASKPQMAPGMPDAFKSQ